MERAVVLRLLSTLEERSGSLLRLVQTVGNNIGPPTETIKKEIFLIHGDCRRLLWHFEKKQDPLLQTWHDSVKSNK
jgi:hypothetical protein